MDKASAHGAGDCRFESCRGHLKGMVAEYIYIYIYIYTYIYVYIHIYAWYTVGKQESSDHGDARHDVFVGFDL